MSIKNHTFYKVVETINEFYDKYEDFEPEKTTVEEIEEDQEGLLYLHSNLDYLIKDAEYKRLKKLIEKLLIEKREFNGKQ